MSQQKQERPQLTLKPDPDALSTWNILRIDYVLGHKASPGSFNKIEITSSVFCDHNIMRLDINYKGKKNTNTWRLNNMVLNNQWKKSKKKSKTTLRQMWPSIEKLGAENTEYHGLRGLPTCLKP